MRTICLLLIMICTTIAKAQTANPFLSLKFDKVVMYDFESKRFEGEIIDDSGKLSDGIVRQVTLDSKTIATLNKKLGEKTSYSGGMNGCFYPHFGFVYYLKGEVVAYISVCFACNILHSNPAISLYERDVPMSSIFRKYLNDLLIKYKFSHQIKKRKGYDY